MSAADPARDNGPPCRTGHAVFFVAIMLEIPNFLCIETFSVGIPYGIVHTESTATLLTN
jgi:hypothetical protein